MALSSIDSSEGEISLFEKWDSLGGIKLAGLSISNSAISHSVKAAGGGEEESVVVSHSDISNLVGIDLLGELGSIFVA